MIYVKNECDFAKYRLQNEKIQHFFGKKFAYVKKNL